MLSKAEMEDIWNNKPVGELLRVCKHLKTTSLYKVTMTPYQRNLLDSKTISVRARNSASAEAEAKLIMKKNLVSQGILYDGFILNSIEVSK